MLPDRYTKENFLKLLYNPTMVIEESHRIISSLLFKINSAQLKYRFGEGVDVMSRDWDNLIILDACRYDYFSKCIGEYDFCGDLERSISKASQSWEFMKNNFEGRSFHDTVYVTANPHVDLLPDGVFYTTYPLLDSWDEDLRTIPPNEVVDAAIQANKSHPNKRLIIHFMQPHLPFLGETATKVRKRVDLKGLNNQEFRREDELSGEGWFHYVETGEISLEESYQAYLETLEIVLDHVQELVGEIDGKSVITADHGEHLGERITPVSERMYGHLGWEEDVYTEQLRTVPWYSIQSETRREIQSDDPTGHKDLDDETRDRRLEALGYL